MRQMKDSGIEWIGKIPETWEVLQIRRIMRNRSERNQPNAVVLSLYRDWGIVPKDSRDDNHNVTSEDTSSYKVVSKGNFVINKMKAWQGSMAVSDYDGIISPAYYVCSFTKEVCKKYVHYLLRDASYKPEYMRLSTGMRIGQWDLNIDDFLRIKAIIPPLADQQRIADYLDEKCVEIDSLIALQEQMIEKLKAYKQSVITEAVTKGLDPNTNFVPSCIEWIGKIPEGWKVCRLKSVARIERGGSPRPIEEYLAEKGYNWIKIGDTIKGNKYISSVRQKIREEGLSKTRMVHVGDLILTNSMSFGEPYILKVDGCIHDGWVAISKIQNIDKVFLYYLLLSPLCQYQFKLQVAGGVVQNLNVDKIAATSIILPPLSEQQDIVSYLDEKCADIDRLIALKQQKIEALKDYKKSVIYEAVTGKTIV